MDNSDIEKQIKKSLPEEKKGQKDLSGVTAYYKLYVDEEYREEDSDSQLAVSDYGEEYIPISVVNLVKSRLQRYRGSSKPLTYFLKKELSVVLLHELSHFATGIHLFHDCIGWDRFLSKTLYGYMASYAPIKGKQPVLFYTEDGKLKRIENKPVLSKIKDVTMDCERCEGFMKAVKVEDDEDRGKITVFKCLNCHNTVRLVGDYTKEEAFS